MSLRSTLPLVAALGCGASHPPPSAATTTQSTKPSPLPTSYRTEVIALPGATATGIAMDYLLFDPRTKAVWVPAGNTGAVDVVDVATRKIARIEHLPTQELQRNGKTRVVGPSAAALGADGVVYVGNRGDSSVCAYDDKTLAKRACGTLDAMPDGLQYVATTKELWVTTPRDKSIRVLDGTTLVQKDRIEFDGAPEGFAADGTRLRFYTNLEDKDVTLAIDLMTHRTVATWKSNCGEDGPHGIRLAEAEGVLFVACNAKVESLDVAHDGALLGSVDTGDGVDDFDYSPARHALYVGAAKDARLTVIAVAANGALSAATTVATQQGARNGVVDGDGAVYLAHSQGSEIIVAVPAR